jgi:uncharacterized protein YndB with AHSA1/START domain
MQDVNKTLNLTRELDTPVAEVYKAWTTPELLKQWWGPNDVSIPECEVDLKVGGRIYIVMEAGEAMGPYKGTKWPMEGTFTTVEPNKRLTYDAKAWTGGQETDTTIETTTDIAFEEVNGKTKVTINAAIHKAGPGAQMAVQGMEHGYNQQMEKLKAFLQK